MQCLENWLEKANLPFVIEDNSLQNRFSIVNNPNIFQITIDVRKSKKNGKEEEYFRMFLGYNNDIRVIDYDAHKKQVLLLVKEPPRTHIRKIWDSKIKKHVLKKVETSEFLRKYLMGMDECHLFISELPSDLGVINKINDAHKVLKPENVIKKEREINRIKRQGEWFFIPIDFKDQIIVENNKDQIKKKARIGYGIGKPHIADHILRIKEKVNKKTKTLTFVKGKIIHEDHRTLYLHGWFKVEKNTEIRPTIKQLNSFSNQKKTKKLDEALFIPATQDELNLMDKYKIKIRKKVCMGNGWKNAFIAEKLLCIKGSRNVKGMTLVNGEIKNKVGKTLRLYNWYKVERNPKHKPNIKSKRNGLKWEKRQSSIEQIGQELRESRQYRKEGDGNLRIYYFD